MTHTDPVHDNKIYQKYSKKTLQNKEKNKIAFCQDFELDYDRKRALLCLSFPLTDENEVEILKDVIEGILEQNVSLALLAIGSEKNQAFFSQLHERYPEKIAIIDNNETNKRRLYAAGDIFLNTSSNKACQDEMKAAMQYGVVPLTPKLKDMSDYNGAKEEGNAFIYKEKSPWSFFASLIRALENFKFPYDWKAIQVNVMAD